MNLVSRISSQENYFNSIEEKFTRVYEKHHTIPNSLWEKLYPVLDNTV